MRRHNFFLLVACVLVLPATLIAQPNINSLSGPSEMRVMDWAQFSVSASGEGTLKYQWTVLNPPPGTNPVVLNGSSLSARLELWWVSATAANQAVGQQFQVEVAVWIDGEDPATAATRTANVSVSGVNRPPVPSIKGDFGSPTARLVPGTSVKPRSTSTDPDGDSPRLDWGFGEKSGPGIYPPGQPIMYGSNGSTPSFIVPDIKAAIDQKVILQLSNGLHQVSTTATVYMGPGTASQPGGNVAPTLTVSQSTVVVGLGQNLVVQATANDSNGDTLALTWLRGSTTVAQQYVETVKSGSTYTSTLTYPTAELGAGTHNFSVQAFETSTADKWGSPKRSIIAIVTTDGGGSAPGFFEEDQGICQSNSGPTLVSIQPDPRSGAVTLVSGQTATFELLFRDTSSENVPPFGLRTGVPVVTWNVAQLTQRGINVNASEPQATSDPQQARVTLSFPVPSGQTGSSQVFATAEDVFGCSTTVGFGMNFSQTSGSNPPVARIYYYRSGEDAPRGPYRGDTVSVAQRTIQLDGSNSSVDESRTVAAYVWNVTGLGAQLSSNTGPETTLTVPGSELGTVTVTLTVTDSAALTDSTTLRFSYASAGEAPSAQILNPPAYVRVGEEFEIRGSGSSNGGSGSFTYQWEARCCGDDWAPMFGDGTRARMTPPSLPSGTEEDVLEVRLTVREDGVASDPEIVEIPLQRSRKYFAQLAVGSFGGTGQRFETSIILINDEDTPAEGKLTFFTQEVGGEVEEWPVSVFDRNGEPVPDAEFEVPALGAEEFLMTGLEELRSGWMQLASNVNLAGHLFYRVVEPGNGSGAEHILFEVPILPVTGNTFRTSLSPGLNNDLALALVNVGETASTIRIAARDASGAVETTINLGPQERFVRFLSELPGPPLLWSNFKGGTLILRGDEGATFVATILKTREGFPLSILPVAVQKN